MLRFYPDKTKLIAFDLEYYVPEEDRTRKSPSGMCFSPVGRGHKVLGGTFQTYYPILDKLGERKNFWEWNLGTEEKVLHSIYGLFEREWSGIEINDQAGSLMLCGIGISHSDIPALLIRMSYFQIKTEQRVYDLICGCRQLDLSTMTLPQFSSKHAYFSYPKSKASLYQKYLGRKLVASGKSVWDLYDGGDFSAIERRCNEEVDDMVSIYKACFDLKKKNLGLLQRLKWFERKGVAKSEL